MRISVSIVSPSTQKCADNFPPPLLLSVPRDNGLVARKTGCPLSPNFSIIDSATLSHSPCGLSLLVEYYFVSDPSPRNDQCPTGNLFANKDTRVELAIHSSSLSLIHHMMSWNIDMKIIRPWNCSGSHILLTNLWTSWTSCNVVNPGKYSTRIPSLLCQLCPKFCSVMNLWTNPIAVPKQYLMLGSDSPFHDKTQKLKIHKPLHTRDWWFLHHWPEIIVTMEKFPSWFETLQKSLIVPISTFQISRTSALKWDFSQYFLKCKLSE